MSAPVNSPRFYADFNGLAALKNSGSASNPAALREAARELSLAEPMLRGNSVEDLYQAEHSLLEGSTIIPLFHLPVASAVGPRVRAWSPDRLGLWNLADLWLDTVHLEDSR